MRFIHRDAHRNLIGAALSPTGEPESGLQGRHGECETLDRLLAAVRAGQSRVMVVRGEAGAGKTALLNYLITRAAGCCRPPRLMRMAASRSLTTALR